MLKIFFDCLNILSFFFMTNEELPTTFQIHGKDFIYRSQWLKFLQNFLHRSQSGCYNLPTYGVLSLIVRKD